MKSLSVIVIKLLILTATFGLSYGQTITTGDVIGTLTDASGALIPAAAVRLKSLDNSGTRIVNANSEGAYRLTLVSPGRYEIAATGPGLRSDITRVLVNVGQVTTANLSLKIESSKQVVQVNEAAPVLQTDNANLATTYSAAQFDVLPTPGGDITSIAFTAPGISVNTGGGVGNFTSHGLPSISNLFTINGVDEMDPYENINNAGASGLTLGQNEIQEVSIVQNGYSAQYGRQAGAQVNFITKSGNDDFHGSLLYTFNGSFLNSNDFFNNQQGLANPRAISNQYGALLSGPIRKNKLFFLVDTEGIRYVLPTTAVVSIPSAALESYTLANVAASQLPFYQKAFAAYNAAPGARGAAAVQNGNGLLQDSNGALGCGELAGTPTGVGSGVFGTNVSCANAYATNLPSQTSEWLLTTRIDYNLNDKNQINARFKTDQGLQPTDPNPISPAFNVISRQPGTEGSLNWTTVISPRMVNNFIGSGNYYSATFSPTSVSAAVAAFPVTLNIEDGGANGSGGLSSLGFNSASYPQGRRVGQLQIVDDLSYSFGNHTLKFGVNYRYNKVTDTSDEELTVGEFNIFGLDEFSSGTINTSSGSTFVQRFTNDPVVHLRIYNAGFYVQDEWAAKANLKITLGLRLDRNGNPSCVDDCFARLNAPFQTIAHGAAIPYNQSVQTGLSNAFYSTEPLVAGPRLGIAWNPGFSKGTVIRGGFGIFADQYPSYFLASLFSQAPNVFTSTVHHALINSAGAGTGPAIAAASAAAFQTGFANGATLAQLQSAVAPVSFSPPGYFSIANQIQASKFAEWSFEIQQQFGSKNVFSASYVGNHGYDIFNRDAKLNASNSLGNYPAGFAGLPLTAPDPRFGVITTLDNSGWSNYDGMILQYRRVLSQGLQGQINYTWSHALDTVSNDGLTLILSPATSLTNQLTPNSKSLNYGDADYDERHQISGDLVYALPFRSSRGALRGMLGGWNLGTKVFFHTGTPFSVIDSRLPGRLSPSTGSTILASAMNPGLTAACGAAAVDAPCLTTSEFAAAASQTNFGNQPRNSYRAPGYVDTDATLYKTFPLWNEASLLKIGAQAYNLFNHPNFAAPGDNVAVSGFGTITSTVSAPTSPYGAFEGSAVSGRVLALTGRITF